MKRMAYPVYFMIIMALAVLSACGPSPVTPTSTDVPVPSRAPTIEPSTDPGGPVDIILYNGNVITIEDAQPQAQAVAISGDKILAVGSDTQVLALQEEGTILVDLQGKTLLPGFISGHTHLLAFSDRMGQDAISAQDAALQYGFTTVSEMWADEGFIGLLQQMEQAGELHLRVNAFPIYNEGDLSGMGQRVRQWFPANPPILDPTSHLRIPGIKIFVDGDMTPRRGCWAVSYPYPDQFLLNNPTCTSQGELYWPDQNELNQVVAQAQAAGYRVSFHAMGDAAIQAALDAIEYALDGQSNDLYRHMIQHNSLVRPDQMDTYAELGIIASVRGYADLCDPDNGDGVFGPGRGALYADRWLLPNMAGVHPFMEDDFAWTDDVNIRFANRTLDPFVNMQGLVTLDYVAADGSVCQEADWVESEGTTIERALEMYTIEPAYAISMEDYIGSIKPGKFADLVVLSGNPLGGSAMDLLDLQVWMTMIDGNVEYCMPGREDYCPGTASGTASTPPSQTAETVIVKWNCDTLEQGPAQVSSTDIVQVNMGWAASNLELANDFLSALQGSINLDGTDIPFQISNSDPEIQNNLGVVQVYFEIGTLIPGTHHVTTTITFSRVISDGYDQIGPGTNIESLQKTCTIVSN